MSKDQTVQTIRDDLGHSIGEIMKRYPKARSAIMPALYLAQEKYGILDGTTYQAIAEILDVPEIWVFEVASFYTLYNRQELGKFHIQLCTNVSCMLLGAYDVLAHLQRRLGIRQGETTADGLFTLSIVECIGSCDVAPSMMINDVFHDNLSLEGMDAIVDGLEESVREEAS